MNTNRTLSISVFIILILLYATNYYYSGIVNDLKDLLYNSDSLYIPSLFRDVLGGTGKFSDWILTPAPYFFPDYVMYAIAYAASPDIFYQILLFSILQITLTALALLPVAGLFLKKQAMEAAVAAVSVLLLLAVAFSGGKRFELLLVSGFHYGAFLCGIVYVFLAARMTATPATGWHLIAATVIAFLTSMSDNLFILQFVLPLAPVILLVSIFARGHGLAISLARFALPVIAAAGGWLTNRVLLGNTSYGVEISLLAIPGRMIELFNNIYVFSPVMFIFQGIVSLLMLAYSVSRISAAARKGISGQDIIVISMTASIISAILGVALISSVDTASRYCLPFIFFPVIFAIFYLFSRFAPVRRHVSFAMPVITAAVLATAAVNARTADPDGRHAGQFYPEYMACIDSAVASRGLKYGVAQYWDAKHIQAFSKNDVVIAQYFANLNEHRWITSARYFRESYDFVITSRLMDEIYWIKASDIEQLSGHPEETVSCGEHTVLLYNRGGVKMDKYAPGAPGRTWKGCELPGMAGVADNSCAMIRKEGAEGYLSFGPYEPLPAGRYTMSITYSSDEPDGTDAGTWDVATNVEGDVRVLERGILPGTGAQERTFSASFNIDAPLGGRPFEIRTMATGHQAMKLVSLGIRRQE